MMSFSILQEIFAGSSLPISIKTRIGFTEPEEFYQILEIYNRYPIAELTIHPRVRQSFYSGDVNIDIFRYAVQNSNAPLCYNGNLTTAEEIRSFSESFPNTDAVMLGRGLVGNPGLVTPGGTTPQRLEAFLNELFEEYAIHFGGTRNAMFRLKENWRYLFCLFETDTKLQKRLRKATEVSDYKSITHEILHTLPMHPQLQADW